MMYLKQFPDICREMGFDVEEKEKTVTLRVTDINVNYSINKKLFLEDLELTIDSYSEVCVAIAIFEAETKAGKYDNLDATELQKLKCVFDKAWETGRLKDDTGMFQTEVDSCHQHAECLKAVLEKLLEKLKKEVDKARLYSTSSHDFPIVMKQIDASCYKAYAIITNQGQRDTLNFDADDSSISYDVADIVYSAIKRNGRIIESFTETSNN